MARRRVSIIIVAVVVVIVVMVMGIIIVGIVAIYRGGSRTRRRRMAWAGDIIMSTVGRRGVDSDVGTRGHGIGATEIVARNEVVVEIRRT